MTHKKKLTIAEQIEHMKNLGIRFHMVSEEKAKDYLINRTYFFKIKAYAKNYDKNREGHYINLDFGYLTELASLDLSLRKLVLSICLEIEHYLKVDINKHLSQNQLEDGYSIIDEFKASDFYVKSGGYKEKTKSHYNCDLIEKYENDYAIWNFVEIISFGELIALYEFYFKKYDEAKTKISDVLFAVKHLRNACAHNNCILNNIRKPIKNNYRLQSFLVNKVHFSTYIAKNKMSRIVSSDFTALLECYSKIVSSPNSKERIFQELKVFDEKIKEKIKIFKCNDEILSLLNFFDKLINFFVIES